MSDWLLGDGTVTLTNRTGGARDNTGRWVAGTASTSTFDSTCQPDRGAQYTAFQTEGARQATYVKVFLPDTATIRTESQVGPTEATTFTHPAYPGLTFRVYRADRRQLADPPHLVAYGVSISEAEGRA